MASQLVCLAGPFKPHRRKFTKLASQKERLMDSTSPDHHKLGHQQSRWNHFSLASEEENVKAEKSKFKGRFPAREAPGRLGFWYLTSCFSYMLRKARAFYNEFCCDALFDDGDDGDHTRALGYDEVMLVDPYFSIPVTPFTSCHAIM